VLAAGERTTDRCTARHPSVRSQQKPSLYLIATTVLTTDSVEGVVNSVRPRLAASSHLIAVDGFSGAGKTTLVERISAALNGTAIHLDCFIDDTTTESDYLAQLRQAEIGTALQAAAPGVIVVDGICVLDVLDTLGHTPDTLLYVQRLSRQEIWNDGIDLEDFVTDPSSLDPSNWLAKQQFSCHVRRQPHLRADVTFLRRESEPVNSRGHR